MATDGPNGDLHMAADEADRLLRLIETTPDHAVRQADQSHAQSISPAITAPSNRRGLPIFVVVLGSLLTGLFTAGFLLSFSSQWGGLHRQSPGTTTSEPSTPKPLDSPETETQSETEVATKGRSDTSDEASSAIVWSACRDDVARDALPPQPGETWWPVVGPVDALDAARRHCRPDAYINKSGNVQVASFRDQQVATSFADQLSGDSSHPWRFWVGDPTMR
jgi:hypothetical protein